MPCGAILMRPQLSSSKDIKGFKDRPQETREALVCRLNEAQDDDCDRLRFWDVGVARGGFFRHSHSKLYPLYQTCWASNREAKPHKPSKNTLPKRSLMVVWQKGGAMNSSRDFQWFHKSRHLDWEIQPSRVSTCFSIYQDLPSPVVFWTPLNLYEATYRHLQPMVLVLSGSHPVQNSCNQSVPPDWSCKSHLPSLLPKWPWNRGGTVAVRSKLN